MTALPWLSIVPASVDLRLVVCDMDGTLLDSKGNLPSDFWSVLKQLRQRDITFVPASGRQLATLQRMFDHEGGPDTYIAENGTIVLHHGEVVSISPVSEATKQRVVELVREAGAKYDVGLVVCGRNSAYVERSDDAFMGKALPYYARLKVVEDLLSVQDSVLKLAIYDFDSAAASQQIYAELHETHQVVVSGEHWTDIMIRGANKGTALEALQRNTALLPSQTAVFGDYLNDLEMLPPARFSFAMANAHPIIHERAAYVAPANTENGVMRVLQHLLS